MKILNRRLVTCGLLLLGLPVMAADHAGPDHDHSDRMLGGGRGVQTTDLPAGRFRNQLEQLPAMARDRALKRLNGFTFPESDAEALHVDAEGGIYYEDSHLPDPNEAEEALAPIAEAGAAAAAVPVSPFPEGLKFHSKPGSANIVHLDFTGHTVSGTAWNDSTGRDPIETVAFSTDGDLSTFSDSEQLAIRRIWQRVAEDYAPFDVDITTEEPSTFNNRTARMLITRTTDATGQANPSSGGGGVAYVNVFGTSSLAFYSPGWVYHNNLSNVESYIAEATSHEAGHNMGLSHDGKTDGTQYYSGHGSGATSWGPIMGVGYNRNVSQWSKGEYYLSNTTQDDLATLAGKLAYRADDHGDTRASASFLTVANGSQVSATNPENDPGNTNPANKGVIDRNTDSDYFAFSTGAGTISLQVAPWQSPSGTRGGNLDVHARLYDDSGSLVAEDNPADITSASLSVNLASGVYYLQISGTNVGSPLVNPPTGYTAYGSIGQYFISGSIVDSGGLVIPPQAEATLADINTTGLANYTFNVVYTDNTAIQVATLDSNDIRVNGPNGYQATAALISVNPPADGSPVTATYRIVPPGATWTPADNGNYSVELLADQAGDVEGAFVAAGSLGAFLCQVPESLYFSSLDTDPGFSFEGDWAHGVPTGQAGDPAAGFTGSSVVGYNLNGNYASKLASVYATSPSINCSGATTVTLQFKRWLGLSNRDSASIEVSSDGTNWSEVWSSTAAILDTSWTTVQYDISAVAANQSAVRIRWGMASKPDPRTSYGWNIDDLELLGNGAGIDTLPPLAVLNAGDLLQESPLHEIAVTFTDNVAVSAASLDGNDLLITGPNTYSNLTQWVGIDEPGDGTPRIATYLVPAPGADWDAVDNGIYQVQLLGGEVSDTSNNAMAGQVLGSFTVAIPLSMQEILVSPVSLLVPEGSSQVFMVSLAEAPPAPLIVSVAHFSGDADLTIQSGASLSFTEDDFDQPQSVVIAAAVDSDADNGSAVFRCSASGLNPVDVLATEQDPGDIDPPTAVLSAGDITTETVFHDIAVTYIDNVAVSAASLDGNDLRVTGPNAYSSTTQLLGIDAPGDGTPRTATYRLSAPGGNWDAADNGLYQVELQNAEVSDTSNNLAENAVLGSFTVNVPQQQQIVVSTAVLSVEEGSSNVFMVSLSRTPQAPLTVSVAYLSGDTDLSVQAGASLRFTIDDFNIPQSVVLAAATDPDQDDGSTVFRCSSSGLDPVDVQAIEQDTTSDALLTVTVNQAAWGRTEPGGGNYPIGSVVSVIAIASNYYAFVSWTGGVTSINNPVQLTMNSDLTVHALFEEILTTAHPTPHAWLADQGFTDNFEQAAESTGANGMPVWQSYIAGLDPNDPDQTLSVDLEFDPESTTPHVLAWSTVPGRLYSLFWSPNLSQPFTVIPEAQDLPWTVNRWTNTVHTVEGTGYFCIGVRLDE